MAKIYLEEVVKELLIALILLTCLVSIFYFKILFTNRYLLSEDPFCQIYPYRQYLAASLKEGRIPLWNPYIFCGSPFLANAQSAIFYPFNLIFLFLNTESALRYSLGFHILLAGVAMFFFLRITSKLRREACLLGAIVFMFSGYIGAHCGHTDIICAIPYLPFFLLFLYLSFYAKRKFWYLLWAGITLSIQIFAGHPQTVYYTLIAGFLYSLTFWDIQMKNPISTFLKFWSVILLLGLGFSAIQWVPTLELMKFSWHGKLPYEIATSESFPIFKLVSLILPNFFGNQFQGYWASIGVWHYSETTAYYGALALFFTFISFFTARGESKKTVIFFSFLFFFSLLLSFGKYTVFYKLLYYLLPGISRLRAPGRALLLFTFAGSVLSAFGFHIIIEEQPKQIMRITKVVNVLLIIILLSGIYLFGYPRLLDRIVLSGMKYTGFYFSRQLHKLPEDKLETVLGHFVSLIKRDLVIFVVIFFLFTFLLNLKNKLDPFFFATFLIGLIIVDLFLFSRAMEYNHPGNYSQLLNTTNPILEKIKTDQEMLFRIYSKIKLPYVGSFREEMVRARVIYLQPNLPMLYKIHTLDGYRGGLLPTKEWLKFIERIDEDNFDSLSLKQLGLANVKYLITDRPVQNTSVQLILTHSVSLDNGLIRSFYLYQNNKWLPHFFITEKINKNSDVIPFSTATVKLIQYKPEFISLEVENDRPCYLFWSSAYYPGWSAYIDGKRTELVKVGELFQSVFIPNMGKHKIEIKYRSRSFIFGKVLSLLTLFTVVVFLFYRSKRKLLF